MKTNYADFAVEIIHATVRLNHHVILEDISWTMPRGGRCFLLGANGAGKTTLIKMLLGYVWPIYGATIRVLGQTYGAVNLPELRRKIAWVSSCMPQMFHSGAKVQDLVLSGTNATYGLFHAVSAPEQCRADKILQMLQIADLAERQWEQLSSGEQIKVLIGRSLMSDPELLILDEPCVYLDMAGREQLLQIIEMLAEKNPAMSILFVSQRIEDILPLFQWGAILKKGHLIANGPRDEILTGERLSAAFDLNIQLQKSASGRYWPLID